MGVGVFWRLSVWRSEHMDWVVEWLQFWHAFGLLLPGGPHGCASIHAPLPIWCKYKMPYVAEVLWMIDCTSGWSHSPNLSHGLYVIL